MVGSRRNTPMKSSTSPLPNGSTLKTANGYLQLSPCHPLLRGKKDSLQWGIGGEAASDVQLGRQIPVTPERLSPLGGDGDEAASDVQLGGQIPVTPEWPWRDDRPPLPGRRGLPKLVTKARGEPLVSHPPVYSGRLKEAWKVHSKLAFREKRRDLRRQGRWGEPRRESHGQQERAKSSRD